MLGPSEVQSWLKSLPLGLKLERLSTQFENRGLRSRRSLAFVKYEDLDAFFFMHLAPYELGRLPEVNLPNRACAQELASHLSAFSSPEPTILLALVRERELCPDHSRPRSPRSFLPAAGVESSGRTILVPRAHNPSAPRQGSRALAGPFSSPEPTILLACGKDRELLPSPTIVQHRKTTIHGLSVKSGKSDWLRIRN